MIGVQKIDNAKSFMKGTGFEPSGDNHEAQSD
jgi:hypothetical protein